MCDSIRSRPFGESTATHLAYSPSTTSADHLDAGTLCSHETNAKGSLATAGAYFTGERRGFRSVPLASQVLEGRPTPASRLGGRPAARDVNPTGARKPRGPSASTRRPADDVPLHGVHRCDPAFGEKRPQRTRAAIPAGAGVFRAYPEPPRGGLSIRSSIRRTYTPVSRLGTKCSRQLGRRSHS